MRPTAEDRYRGASRVLWGDEPIAMRSVTGLTIARKISHQPPRRRERAMLGFRSVKTCQTFSSAHAQVHNHFSHKRHLISRQVYKQGCSATLAEWRAIAARHVA
jgi:transposase-like protein